MPPKRARTVWWASILASSMRYLNRTLANLAPQSQGGRGRRIFDPSTKAADRPSGEKDEEYYGVDTSITYARCPRYLHRRRGPFATRSASARAARRCTDAENASDRGRLRQGQAAVAEGVAAFPSRENLVTLRGLCMWKALGRYEWREVAA